MPLEDHLMALIVCFKKYAAKDGNKDGLSKSELFDLAKAELPLLCNNPNKDQILNQVFATMDSDGNGQISLTEYCIFLCALMNILGEGC